MVGKMAALLAGLLITAAAEGCAPAPPPRAGAPGRAPAPVAGAGRPAHPEDRATSAPAPRPLAPHAAKPKAVGPPWRPGYVRPPVIDIHTHIMPSGLPRLRKIMRDNGLAYVNNVSGGSPGHGLDRRVAMAGALPGLSNFYTPPWRDRNQPGFGARCASELEYAVKVKGFKGLKIAKTLGLFATDRQGKLLPVDWPELDPLWDMAGQLGVPVAIHTGDPKAFWEPVTPANERYAELKVHPHWSFAGPRYPSRQELLAQRDRVLARHRGTTFICVHFGGNPEDLGYVERLLANNPNAVVDVAARVPEIGRHPPAQVRALFIKYKDRIVFGTDLAVSARGLMLGSTGATPATMADVKPFYDATWRYFEGSERGIPHPTPIQGDWTVDAIHLPDDVLQALYHDNAVRLLHLEGAPAWPRGAP